MTDIRSSSKLSDINSEELVNHRSSPIPLMSLTFPASANPHRVPSSCRTSISDAISTSPTAPISILDDNFSSTSTLIDRIDASKFYFAHVIKVPHGTNLLASDNQSTTVCINSTGNIIHLITLTGYHIRSSRWPHTENKIIDLLWCETLQVYLAATLTNLYTIKCDSDQLLLVEKCLDFPSHYRLSSNVFITCNSYRLYIHSQSTNLLDVYTFQFAHLHTKQFPDSLNNKQIETLTCSDSYLIFNLKENTNQIILLDPITMTIDYEFDLLYENISSIRSFDNENTLILIGMKPNGENRLIFLNFGNENQQAIVEKGLECNDKFVYLLPNCRDLIIFNVNAARVQYLKYRS